MSSFALHFTITRAVYCFLCGQHRNRAIMEVGLMQRRLEDYTKSLFMTFDSLTARNLLVGLQIITLNELIFHFCCCCCWPFFSFCVWWWLSRAYWMHSFCSFSSCKMRATLVLWERLFPSSSMIPRSCSVISPRLCNSSILHSRFFISSNLDDNPTRLGLKCLAQVQLTGI